VFPLLCPLCGAEMRIIAFITVASTVRDILVHLGEPAAPPRMAPARARRCGWRPALSRIRHPIRAIQPAPAYEFDQRIAW
jgi:hypothetical protein